MKINMETSQSIDLNEFFTAIFEKYAQNNNLLEWHQIYFDNQNNFNDKSFDLNENFKQIYRLKIFESYSMNILKIWKLFVKNFSTNNSVTLQLFCLFSKHVRFDNHMIDSLSKHFETFIESLAEKLSIINEHDQLCNHHFEIYFIMANIIANFFPHKHPSMTTNHIYDLTSIFPTTSIKLWQNYFNNYDNLSCENQLYFIRLLLINYRYIKFYNHSNDQNIELMNQILISKQLILMPNEFNFIIEELMNDETDLKLIFEFLFESLHNNQRIDECIGKILKHEKHWEHKQFQNMFVMIFLRKLKYLLPTIFTENSEIKNKYLCKYGGDMPDLDKHKKLIDSLQSFAQPFIQSNQSDLLMNSNMDKLTVKQIIKLFQLLLHCAPLEYLSPFHQISFILVSWAIQFNFICSGSNHVFTDIYLDLNIRLWYSIRKLWLFDFIEANKYIYSILSNVWKFQVADTKKIETLFDRFIWTMFQLNNHELLLEEFLKLVNLLKCHDNLDNDQSIEYILKFERLLIQNVRQFRKKFMNNQRKFSEEFVLNFNEIYGKLIEKLYKLIHKYLKQSIDFQTDRNFQSITNLIIELFEEKLISNMTNDEISNDKWTKLFQKFLNISKDMNNYRNESMINFIVFVLKHHKELKHLMSDDFQDDQWNKMLELNSTDVNSNDSKEIIDMKINSKSQWKKLFESNLNEFDEFQSVSSKVFDMRNDEKILQTFNESNELITLIDPLVAPLLESIDDAARLEQYLQQCLNCIQSEHLYFPHLKYLMNILVKFSIETVVNNIDKAKILCKYFNVIIETFLMTIFVINNKIQVNDEDIIILTSINTIKSQILKFYQYSFECFIRHNLLTNLHLFLFQNLCIEMNILRNLDWKSLIQIQQIIHLLTVKVPYLYMESMCVNHLSLRMNLCLLFEILNHKSLNEDNFKELEQCSKLFQQTIVQLSKYDEFQSKYSIHLLSDYLESSFLHIDQSRNNNSILKIKENLQQTIYHLIDLLIKSSNGQSLMDNLYTRINSEKSRQLLRTLLDSYNHYYRFKGYV